MVLAAFIVGCGEPATVSAEDGLEASTTWRAASSTTSSSPLSATTTMLVSDGPFPEILLLEPRGDIGWGELELAILAGVSSYRVAYASEHRQGLTVRIASETAGQTSWHRVELEPPNETGPTEWITSSASVWALVAGAWVPYDLTQHEGQWEVALAPWQFSDPMYVYSQVYRAFPGLEPQRWVEVEGREVVVYAGGNEAQARFFDEETEAVISGRIEVWMDPAGFPLRVVTEASEVRDLSIPHSLEWSLSGLGAVIEFDLPDDIATAIANTPILAVGEKGVCPGPDPADEGCPRAIAVYDDGRWEIVTEGQDPRSGILEPPAIEPLQAALKAIDLTQLITPLSQGDCSLDVFGQEQIILFPTMAGYETYATCTHPPNSEWSPYKEALDLISRLPLT